MANKKIKGITIRLDAEASSLDKVLKDVENTSKGLNGELKQVNNLLKFDPKNTELLAQKQKILTDSIENSSKKLKALKQAQSEVEKMFKAGEDCGRNRTVIAFLYGADGPDEGRTEEACGRHEAVEYVSSGDGERPG